MVDEIRSYISAKFFNFRYLLIKIIAGNDTFIINVKHSKSVYFNTEKYEKPLRLNKCYQNKRTKKVIK